MSAGSIIFCGALSVPLIPSQSLQVFDQHLRVGLERIRTSLASNGDKISLRHLVQAFDLEEHWCVERGLQKRFSIYIMKQQVEAFFEQLDALTRANTLSFTLSHATGYLFAKPSRNLGLKFRNSKFRSTLCRKLRVQIFEQTRNAFSVKHH